MASKEKNFKLIGPVSIFKSNYPDKTFIGKKAANIFLNELKVRNIFDMKGCYIFACKAGRGYKPWYVGKTSNSFGKECMVSHKLQNYNEAIKNYKNAPTSVMFFLTKESNPKLVDKRILKELEGFLIKESFKKNSELTNIQNANKPEWIIDGVIRSHRRPNKTEIAFKKMLGIK